MYISWLSVPPASSLKRQTLMSLEASMVPLQLFYFVTLVVCQLYPLASVWPASQQLDALVRAAMEGKP